MSASAVLQLKHIFGLRTDVRNGVHFVNQSVVAFVGGHNVVLHSLETRSQSFLPGAADATRITAMTVSPNRRLLALAERCGERPTVTVYDLTTGKKRKVLSQTEAGTKEYVCLAFSHDGAFLAAQGGAPEWNLAMWQWEKSKLSGVVKGVTQAGSPVCQVLFSCHGNGTEMSANTVSIAANGAFKCFRAADGTLKPIAVANAKHSSQNFTCHAWLAEGDRLERAFVGAATGEVLMFENGEARGSVLVAGGLRLTCMLGHANGVIVGTTTGSICFLEQTGEEYRSSPPIQIPGQDDRKVVALTLAPNEEQLLAALDDGGLWALDLTRLNSLPAGESAFKAILAPVHMGDIFGADMCIRRPLAVTTGADKTLRMWNHVERRVELCREFGEDVYSTALHPSGELLLLGCATRLRMYSVLADDIRLLREIGIKSCREVRFSHGGAFFAAANSAAVQVYGSYTAENVGNLRGHSGKVRSISWSPDDTRIISAGVDGAVYEWRVSTMRRERENVLKGCNYACAITTVDGASIFAAGSDRKLKHMQDADGTGLVPVAEYEGTTAITQMALPSSSGARTLFAGTEDGCIRSYKYPLTGEQQDLRCAAGCITRLQLSHDDGMLVAAAADGCLLVFDVRDRDVTRLGKGAAQERLPYAEEVLVLRADVDERLQRISELEHQVKELTSQGDYQLRLRDLQTEDKLKALTYVAAAQAAAAKARHDALDKDKRTGEAGYEARLRKAEEHVSAIAAAAETRSQAKMLAEVERYKELVKAKDALGAEWEARMTDTVARHAQQMAAAAAGYEARLEDVRRELAAVQLAKGEGEREMREVAARAEEDTDAEIQALTQKFEAKAAVDLEASQRLKGEHGILLRRFAAVEKETQALRDQIKALTAQKATAAQTIGGLEKDIDALRTELGARDDMIGEKEERIAQIKRRAQELEKLQFVLEFKIEELRGELEPKEQRIAQLTADLAAAQSEADGGRKSVGDLTRAAAMMRDKAVAARREADRLRSVVNATQSGTRHFQRDLYAATELLTDPARLKAAVMELHRRHGGGSAAAGGVEEVQGEQPALGTQPSNGAVSATASEAKQVEVLEGVVAGLKRRMAHDETLRKADHTRLLQENGELIREINELRRELHAARKAVINASSFAGRHGARGRGRGQAVCSIVATADESPVEDEAYEEEEEGFMARGIGWDSGQHAAPVFTADGTQTEDGVWPQAASGGQPASGTGPARPNPMPQQRITQQQGSGAGSMPSAAAGAPDEPAHTAVMPAPAADTALRQWVPDAEAAPESRDVPSREAGLRDSWSAASKPAAPVNVPSADVATINTAPAGVASVEHTEDLNNMAVPVERPYDAWQQKSSATGSRLQDRSFFMDADRGNDTAEMVRLAGSAAAAGGGVQGSDSDIASQHGDAAHDEQANNEAGSVSSSAPASRVSPTASAQPADTVSSSPSAAVAAPGTAAASTLLSAPRAPPPVAALQLPTATEAATVAAAGAAVLGQVAALRGASPAAHAPATVVAAAGQEPSLNVAQRVAALERRLAAELARSAGLQDELARRDVRIRRLEAAIATADGVSLRQPPDMSGWSAAAVRAAGPTGSGPST